MRCYIFDLPNMVTVDCVDDIVGHQDEVVLNLVFESPYPPPSPTAKSDLSKSSSLHKTSSSGTIEEFILDAGKDMRTLSLSHCVKACALLAIQLSLPIKSVESFQCPFTERKSTSSFCNLSGVLKKRITNLFKSKTSGYKRQESDLGYHSQTSPLSPSSNHNAPHDKSASLPNYYQHHSASPSIHHSTLVHHAQTPVALNQHSKNNGHANNGLTSGSLQRDLCIEEELEHRLIQVNLLSFSWNLLGNKDCRYSWLVSAFSITGQKLSYQVNPTSHLRMQGNF